LKLREKGGGEARPMENARQTAVVNKRRQKGENENKRGGVIKNKEITMNTNSTGKGRLKVTFLSKTKAEVRSRKVLRTASKLTTARPREKAENRYRI